MLGHQTKVSTLRGMKRKAQPSPRQDSLSGEPGPILGNLNLDRSDFSTMGLQRDGSTPCSSISDNVLIAHEVLEFLRKAKKGKTYLAALKLDISKAYDRFDMQLVLGAPQVPCYFSFGDSIADNGNNNNLPTIAKANYPPYGIDFPDGSTGRYTNGRNIPDFIAQLLGFDNFIPPYATARGQDIIKGVNYGSGGAGIRDETSFQLEPKIENEGNLKMSCSSSAGGSTEDLRYQYLFCSCGRKAVGNLDILPTNRYGGCFPSICQFNPNHRGFMYSFLNDGGLCGFCENHKGLKCNLPAVQILNDRLKPLVDDLNSQLVGAKFIYLKTSSIQSGDPTSLGIQFFTEPCCQVDSSTGLCILGSTPCSNRTQYAFYDAIHPTETVYQAYSIRAVDSVLPSDAYPMDIRHLAQL
nr:GDSL esterase/lipase At4g18970-like [Coffea arabica]